MKKTIEKKLALNRKMIANLNASQLGFFIGGVDVYPTEPSGVRCCVPDTKLGCISDHLPESVCPCG